MTVAAKSAPGWDFFVSYTQADRAWAEWIAWVLEEDRYAVLIQAWDMVPGVNWTQVMQDGVTRAARTIAVLSADYIESQFGSQEWQAAWRADPDGAERKLLVARVADCDRPGLLGGVVSVDVFGADEATAAARLRRMVGDALAGRAKPATRPAFPAGARASTGAPRFPGALPRIWNVPARNPNFTGRAAELDTVRAALAGGTTTTVQSVRGLGGVGKSQLAAEYAHAHAAGYDVVFWVAAEVPAVLPDQFARLAAQLGLGDITDPDVLRERVHAGLRGVASWLLIFDNADAVDDIAAWIPGDPRPPGARGHVLVTTRRGGFKTLGRVLDLDLMETAEAVALLRTRVPGIAERTAEAIAAELGRLPLALEQAGAYLDKTGMEPAEYLALLRERAAELYERGQVAGRKDTIATLWDLSLERVAGESPAAVQLVDLCAYLAPELVPTDLFTTHADLLPEPLSAAAGDPLGFGEAVGALVDYSLVKRAASDVQLHRLVQGAIRGHHAHATALLAVVLSLLRADAPRRIMGAPEAWPRWAALLPHVLAATGNADQSLAELDTGAKDDLSWLLDRAATYLQIHARLTEARPLAERALAIDEAAHGPDHPAVGTRLSNLALVLCDLGQPRQARPLAERALAIAEAAHGPYHPAVGTRLSNLALILCDLGQPGQARPLAERALAIMESAYGPEHPSSVTMRKNLAALVEPTARRRRHRWRLRSSADQDRRRRADTGQ